MTGSKDRRRRSFAGGQPDQGVRQRQRRVGEEVRHALARILRGDGCRDPALHGASITVSEVRISPDLRNAKAYVMPLGGANAGAIIAGLKRSTPFLRAHLARDLPLRYAPNLAFALDDTFDHAHRIATLLARPEVERDLHPQTLGRETDDDAG